METFSRRHHSKDTKKKISLNNARYWKGKKRSEEWKRKVREKMKLYRQTPLVKIRTSEVSKELWKGDDYRKKVIDGLANSWNEEEHKKRKDMLIKLWQNPEYRENQIRLILKGRMKRPTKLEQQLINLINENNLPFKYCGDGEVIIGGFNPDFIECNGKKLLIETAGSYRHDKNYEKQRYAIFKKYGFRTLFIWDYEIFTTKHYNRYVDNWKEVCLNKMRVFLGES